MTLAQVYLLADEEAAIQQQQRRPGGEATAQQGTVMDIASLAGMSLT